MIKQLNVYQYRIKISDSTQNIRLQVVSPDQVLVSTSLSDFGWVVDHTEGILEYTGDIYVRSANALSRSVIRYETKQA